MADPVASLLAHAHTAVAELLAHLRAEAERLQAAQASAGQRSRHLLRQLDELAVQRSFAEQLNPGNLVRLQQQEAALRAEYATTTNLANNGADAAKRITQLIRQLEMSSSILTDGPVTADRADPWMLALRGQIIHGREEERTRLAREVHDGPAQVLANVLMGLEHAINLTRDRHELLQDFLPELRDAARQGLHEVRGFIADLRPGALDQGLPAALADYIRTFERTTTVRVTLDLHDWPPHAPKEAEIVLYRVTQEALQNVNKHARTAHVLIRSFQAQNILTFVIRDDGPGFDAREVARRTGKVSWGLTSMRERVALVGGEFAIASRPGAGTEVTIRLPL